MTLEANLLRTECRVESSGEISGFGERNGDGAELSPVLETNNSIFSQADFLFTSFTLCSNEMLTTYSFGNFNSKYEFKCFSQI